MKKIKKTFELSESTANKIKEIADFFGLNEVDIVQSAIENPKVFAVSLVFYEKLRDIYYVENIRNEEMLKKEEMK